MDTGGRLPQIDALLATRPPSKVYHYTSAEALISILSSKTIWASGIAFTNDRAEARPALEIAERVLESFSLSKSKRAGLTSRQLELLEAISEGMHAANRQIYFVSFSTQADSLPQWRAYCPSHGGYALGIPSRQVKAVASAQGFYFGQCVYEDGYRLVHSMLDAHLSAFETGSTPLDDEALTCAARAFGQDLAQFGPFLKHRSFADEHEWRAVSTPKQIGQAGLGFHSGLRGVVPHFDLHLTTDEYPNLIDPSGADNSTGVVVGPTVDVAASSFAAQALLHHSLGPGCWIAQSQSPYRGF